jgi:hypothetical protein
MSLVDLQLWVFKLFRLHPETQDLEVQGFLKQHTVDISDDFEPEWYLEYVTWENRTVFSIPIGTGAPLPINSREEKT